MVDITYIWLTFSPITHLWWEKFEIQWLATFSHGLFCTYLNLPNQNIDTMNGISLMIYCQSAVTFVEPTCDRTFGMR